MKHRRLNLSIQEKQAIKNLSSNRAIVIKPADKGSGVIIMNTQDYIREALRQLSDTNFYEKLDSDSSEIFSLTIDTFLQKLVNNKEIDQKTYLFLSPIQYEAHPGRFYLLPKIHKGILPPPGAPLSLL